MIEMNVEISKTRDERDTIQNVRSEARSNRI